MWILFAFIAPAFYGVAEILDNFLSNKIFKHPLTLAFFASMFNFLVIPIFFIFNPPTWPPLTTIPIFLILGFVEFGYLYPYYKGLQNEDTSVVSAFFGLGRIFIPILAFLIVGEILSLVQYIGIVLIISASILLSFKKKHTKLLFSKSFWYIGLAAFMLSFEGVLLKYLFQNGVSYSTAIGGEMLVAAMFSLFLLFSNKVRHDIVSSTKAIKIFFPLFVFEEVITFLAFAAEAYAIDKAPVTIVKAIGMFIPFFILFYGKMLKTRFPTVFKESTNTGIIIKRIILFTVMVAGILLLGNYD